MSVKRLLDLQADSSPSLRDQSDAEGSWQEKQILRPETGLRMTVVAPLRCGGAPQDDRGLSAHHSDRSQRHSEEPVRPPLANGPERSEGSQDEERRGICCGRLIGWNQKQILLPPCGIRITRMAAAA